MPARYIHTLNRRIRFGVSAACLVFPSLVPLACVEGQQRDVAEVSAPGDTAIEQTSGHPTRAAVTQSGFDTTAVSQTTVLVSASHPSWDVANAPAGDQRGSDRLDEMFAAFPPRLFAQLLPDTAGAAAWVDSLLQTMTLRDKIAQLVIADFRVDPGAAAGSPAVPPDMAALAAKIGVGGFLVPRVMPPGDLRKAIEEVQELAGVPLLVAADFERGAGRFSNNLTELPSSMAIGSTGEPVLAAAAGRLSALESRALGVNMLLAPVADVNRNPHNPIINIRAFGDNPALVTSFATSYSAEAERWGVLTTFKHYPGHGNTSEDSHTRLAVLQGDISEIRETDLHPFLTAVQSASPPAAIMTAHVWVPALDDTPLASTFSHGVITTVLREEAGYDGLVVTDDLRMAALSSDYKLEERVVRPLLAGADVLLTPEEPARAIEAVERAVDRGRVPRMTIDLAARRVLRAKAVLGLHTQRIARPELLDELMSLPYGQAIADTIAERSITRVGAAMAHLEAGNVQVVHLANFVGSESIAAAADSIDAWLGAVESVRSSVEITDATRLRMLKQLEGDSPMLIVLYQRLSSGRGEAGLFRGHRELVRSLIAMPRPVVVLSLGNPYEVGEFTRARAIFVGYDQTIATARSAVNTLLGKTAPRGRLPVKLAPRDD